MEGVEVSGGVGFPQDVWIKLIYMSLTKKDLDQ